MDQDLIERTRGLCARLVEIAPWWAGWWTPVPPERLETFEADHGITLPSGYRRLLTEIGEHAPLPGHSPGGVLGLDEALEQPCVREWLGALARPFAGAGKQPVELEWDDDADSYTDPTPLAGCLPVADGGCDLTYLLVVTGADRGRVWTFSPSGSPELRPTGADFSSWYVRELERGLAPLEAQAQELADLERRVATNPDNASATVALGRRLLLLDLPRARSLLERAWSGIDSLDTETRLELQRAIAELDLLDHRRDRIDSLADSEDHWLRSYAGIAASRAGEYERTIELIEPAKVPVLLRAAAIGHLAAALAALGRVEHALELLRGTQASASNHALAAQLRSSLGQREAALRSWREALATRERSASEPRPPRLADFIELPMAGMDPLGRL